MANKFFLHPFNDSSELVRRGIVTIHAEASQAEIAAKIDKQVMMAGIGKIVHVEVKTDKDVLISAWDVRKNTIVQTDGEGSADFEMACFNRTNQEIDMTEPTTEMTAEEKVAAQKSERERIKAEKMAEREAAKAAKGEEAAKIKAEKDEQKKASSEQKAKEREELKAQKAAEREAKKAEREAARESGKLPKGPTKKGRVHEMISAAGGATIEDIAAALEISETAARSLISDLKRANITVTTSKNEETKKTHYHAAAPAAAAETAEAGEEASSETPAESAPVDGETVSEDA